MKLFFISWLFLTLIGPLWILLTGQVDLKADYRTANRDSSHLAPNPQTAREAVIQAYAARAFNWRGIFASHCWIAVKPKDASNYTVYQVVGWLTYRNLPALTIVEDIPDRNWYNQTPKLILDIRGEKAEALIPKIDKEAKKYPYAAPYVLWPGPNSNTFPAYVARKIPELGLAMPADAVGKDFLPGGAIFAKAPSGTGYQISLFGVLGLLAAKKEGIEVNILGFTPVGNSTTQFTGNFEGLGHTINDLTINQPSSTGTIGLFGDVGGYHVIADIGLTNESITGGSGDTGGLVGENNMYDIINNSYSTGSISGSSGAVGGLVGENAYGTMNNTYSTAAVTSTQPGNNTGGLVGYNGGTITNSYATGAVTDNSTDGGGYIGGLVGTNGGTITNSYATGAVTDNSNAGGGIDIGGLVGVNGGPITNSYATGAVTDNTGGGDAIGGLVGVNGGTMTNSYATGAVTDNSTDGGDDIGGLMGYNGGTITNSYATGAVTDNADNDIGGLVGYNCSTISNSYATGAVTNNYTGGYIGGLVGYNNGGNYNNDFWDMDTTGQIASGGGTGLHTSDMQKLSTFTGAGWDAVNTVDYGHVWYIGPTDGITYPKLQAIAANMPSIITSTGGSNPSPQLPLSPPVVTTIPVSVPVTTPAGNTTPAPTTVPGTTAVNNNQAAIEQVFSAGADPANTYSSSTTNSTYLLFGVLPGLQHANGSSFTLIINSFSNSINLPTLADLYAPLSINQTAANNNASPTAQVPANNNQPVVGNSESEDKPTNTSTDQNKKKARHEQRTRDRLLRTSRLLRRGGETS